MSKKTETLALIDNNQVSNFAALNLNSEEIALALRENLGNEKLSAKDLDVVKVPAGGGLAWEIPSIDGIQTEKEFSGIIIHWTPPRTYWEQAFTGDNTPPTCYSLDGLVGIGTPGGDCEKCPFSQWGSGINGSQACHQSRQLFVLLEENVLPIIVRLPPTSIKPCRKYFQRLASQAMPTSSVVTKFTLEKDKSASNFTYSRVVLTVERRLTPEENARIQALKAAIAPQLERAVVIDREVE